MFTYESHYLCLKCYEKITSIKERSTNQIAATINYLTDDIYYCTGLTSEPPRMRIPQPIIQRNQMKYNNIKVDNSIVGAINTGDATSLDVSLESIRMEVSPELSKSLSEFANSLLETQELDISVKNEILEQLAFISNELCSPKIRVNLVKPLLDKITSLVSTVSSLAQLWSVVLTLLPR